MHGSYAFEREEIVLHREHTFLHFAAIPCVEDDLLLGSNVEEHCGFRMKSEFFPVFHLSLRSIVNHEIGFLLEICLALGTDKHVGYEMSLPSHFHDEAHFHAGVLVCTAETVNHIQFLV